MPRNSNLIPSVITDVNGRVTTVYRKPETAVPLISRLPAPVLNGGVAGLVLRIGDRLRFGDRKRHDLKSSLRSCSPQFLEWVDSLLAGDKKVVAGVVELVTAGASESQIRDTVFFHEKLRDAGTDEGVQETFLLVCGLSRYEEFEEVSEFNGENGDVIEQCVGLLQVAIALERESSGSLGTGSLMGLQITRGMIFNVGIKNLVLENPGRAGEITRTIHEHHTADVSVIRGLLEGTTSSLASGTL